MLFRPNCCDLSTFIPTIICFERHCHLTATILFKNSQKMANNRDMFNLLTNSLLSSIVSFLPFKEAARTCVLSKQWRNAWRETSDIEFNESFFVNFDDDEETRKIQRSGFIDFMRKFMANYPRRTVQKIVLVFSKPGEFVSDMRMIVSFTVRHDVRELELDFTDRRDGNVNRDPLFELPLCVYQSKSIESLKLCSCGFDTSKIIKFEILSSLSLEGIKLNFDSIKNLLKGCPLLKKLSLKKCWNMNALEITVPNSNLKHLVLEECEFAKDSYLIENVKLEYFKYYGKIGHFVLGYQDAMIEADLDFSLEDDFSEVGELLYNLLQELFSVQILTVCTVLLQIIPHGEEPMGLQNPLNVNHLILRTALDDSEFCGLKFMFRSCPILETLTIHLGPAKVFPDYEKPYPFESDEFWRKNLVVEQCIKRTLKVVNVKEFKGTLNEFHVLRYILHFGREMEQLNLYISNDDDGAGGSRDMYVGRAQQLIQYHNKASQNLQITIF